MRITKRYQRGVLPSGRLLTREEEQQLFSRLHRLKARFADGGGGPSAGVSAASAVDEKRMERVRTLADRLRNRILQANTSLVCSVAKRFVSPMRPLPDLVSDGIVCLLRAIDKFDETRGFKFSTYATVALMRGFTRDRGSDVRERIRFRTSSEAINAVESEPSDSRDEETVATVAMGVRKVLNQLDQRERAVISMRFGLGGQEKPRTLAEVGRHLGISKERVRQIVVRSMSQARSLAEADRLDEYLP